MTTTAQVPRQTATVRLSKLTSEELFVLSVFVGPGERAAIQAELEKRAVRAEVNRILDRPIPPPIGTRPQPPCPA